MDPIWRYAKGKDVLVCMYSGLPEPPTLNAILVLSGYFRSVTMLRNNIRFDPASYPQRPLLKEVGRCYDVQEAAAKSSIWKMARFARYCLAMARSLRTRKHGLVVIHDYLGLLAYWLVLPVTGYRGLSWFNSYDVIDTEHIPMGRFSLMRLVVRYHRRIFGCVDYFSLPARERLSYYPAEAVRRETFVIPNFPAVRFYERFYQARRLSAGQPVRLIYQGALGPGHGYEAVIDILDRKVNGHPLELVLKGWIDPGYKASLEERARSRGVADRLSFHGFSLYSSVPQLASTCTIGLAIFTKQDVMNKTLGTASNKIYEYAAVGLPVVLFDTAHFREYLEQWPWAYFTDLSADNLTTVISAVLNRYQESSRSAYDSFRTAFNFENVFVPALATVARAMHQQEHVTR
jgi:glycosyltransferase involved in cell wall biosynthesis